MNAEDLNKLYNLTGAGITHDVVLLFVFGSVLKNLVWNVEVKYSSHSKP